MKKTPLKRKTPLKAYTRLVAKTPLKSESPLKTYSKKRAKVEKERYSIFTSDLKHCIEDKDHTGHIDKHEIFNGKNRLKSMKYGLVVPLCRNCHNNDEIVVKWQVKGRQAFIKEYGEEKFVKEFQTRKGSVNMNRYTFKAKRVDNGEWVEGYYLLNETTKIVVPQTWDSWLTYEVIPETISQCTGLKDKLGNEIYENDIVKFDSIETFIVKYDYTSFKLEQIDKQYCDEMSMFYHRIPTMFEVIGNVFDKEVE